MKKLLFILIGFVLTLNTYSSEIPRIESKIKLESWMTELFIRDGGETFSLKGVDKTGGAYLINLSESEYHYNGDRYNVYNTRYGDDNIKIAVSDNKYIVIIDNTLIFYGYSQNVFGVKKIMFSNPNAPKNLNVVEYSKQTKLFSGKRNEVETITTIAENFPLLKKKV